MERIMAKLISIGAVWDDAVRVLHDRGGRMVGVGLVAFVMPPVVQAAIRLFTPFSPARSAILALVVSIAGVLLSLWGALAVLAIAAERPASGPVARTAASRRLPASIGVAAALAVGAVLLTIPLGLAAVAAGADVAAMSQGAAGMSRMTSRGGWTILLVTLAVLALFVWVSARLIPIQAVILHERLGLRAITRAFASTQGLALRLVAVELVFVAAILVSSLAAQAVVATVLFLVLGPDRVDLVLFVAAIAGALAAAALTAIAWVFVARLYDALSSRRAGSVVHA